MFLSDRGHYTYQEVIRWLTKTDSRNLKRTHKKCANKTRLPLAAQVVTKAIKTKAATTMNSLRKPTRKRFAKKTNNPWRKRTNNSNNSARNSYHFYAPTNPIYLGRWDFAIFCPATPPDKTILSASSTDRSNTSIRSRSNQCKSPANW